jgi:hypothetical protein
MKTPREILLRHHQAASPKLDAIRADVVASVARPPAPQSMSWREMARSMRWHLAALSAAWVVVILLNIDHSPDAMAMTPRDKLPSAQQIWAAFRENRRLLREYGDVPASVETPAAPGRRSEIQTQRLAV